LRLTKIKSLCFSRFADLIGIKTLNLSLDGIGLKEYEYTANLDIGFDRIGTICLFCSLYKY